MRCTPYGVKPYLKRLLTMKAKREGWVKIYEPLGDCDKHEEEQ